MEKIGFNLMQVIVENIDGIERFTDDPKKELFDGITKTSFPFEGTYYDIEYENCDEYLWLYFNYGKSSPRNDKITNIATGEKKNNLRNVDEAELLGQLFVCYSYDKKVLYLSSVKKKKVIEAFIKENINIDINIKSFYKNAEEIISILKKVDRINFTQVNNLFAQNSKERQALIDLTGTDAPTSFTIEASYGAHRLDNFIRTLFRSREESKIDDLVICGRDESDFTFVYNMDSFSRKIDVLVENKEETGLFDPNSVKQALLNKLR